MIQAIEQRRQTMLKVMNFIVDRQREFFEKGVEYLKPLTLREVAEHIDMHESTVSRVTNEKYVQTPAWRVSAQVLLLERPVDGLRRGRFGPGRPRPRSRSWSTTKTRRHR